MMLNSIPKVAFDMGIGFKGYEELGKNILA